MYRCEVKSRNPFAFHQRIFVCSRAADELRSLQRVLLGICGGGWQLFAVRRRTGLLLSLESCLCGVPERIEIQAIGASNVNKMIENLNFIFFGAY